MKHILNRQVLILAAIFLFIYLGYIVIAALVGIALAMDIVHQSNKERDKEYFKLRKKLHKPLGKFYEALNKMGKSQEELDKDKEEFITHITKIACSQEE